MDEITISGHSDDIISVVGTVKGKKFSDEFYKEFIEIDVEGDQGVARNLIEANYTHNGVWEFDFVGEMVGLTIESHTKPTQEEIKNDTCYTENLTISGNILAVRAWGNNPPSKEEIIDYLEERLHDLDLKTAREVFDIFEKFHAEN